MHWKENSLYNKLQCSEKLFQTHMLRVGNWTPVLRPPGSGVQALPWPLESPSRPPLRVASQLPMASSTINLKENAPKAFQQRKNKEYFPHGTKSFIKKKKKHNYCGKVKVKCTFKNLVNILLGNSLLKKLWGSWTKVLTWTQFQIKTTVLKTYTFRVKHQGEPGSLVPRTLTVHGLPVCQEVKRHRKLAWALFVLASAENCLFCFSACPWPHLFLFYLSSSTVILFTRAPGKQQDCGISTQMTEDKTPGAGRVCTLRS